VIFSPICSSILPVIPTQTLNRLLQFRDWNQ
jgi:hypothetical protein